MKSLAAFIAALSLTGSILTGPALAEKEEGAKGLFFQQLEHPSANLNTGIQYWIELHHGDQTIHATNKTAFHTGDKIRFHVRPNIDGYAYIMLKSGSRGESAVLFPSKDRDENNKITHGKEIVLPNDGMLSFDENPGVEKLTLLVSRKPIDTDAYLNASSSANDSTVASSETAPRLVAMASSGSKDLIPNQVLVAYLPSSLGAPESVKTAAANASKPSATVTTKPVATADKTTTVKTAKSKITTSKTAAGLQSSKVAATTTRKAASQATTDATSTTTSKANARIVSTKSDNALQKTKHHVAMKDNSETQLAVADTEDASAPAMRLDKGPLKAGLVTVVFKNPDSVLAADISLEHLKD